MPLTEKSDGLAEANRFTAPWVNDFFDLLTGIMNDQAVTLDYEPGSGTTPTLTLKGDGHGPLLKGLKTDGVTMAFQIDANGLLRVIDATAGGLTLARFKAWGTASAGKTIWIMNDGDTDPTAADGLVGGDIVLTVSTS